MNDFNVSYSNTDDNAGFLSKEWMICEIGDIANIVTGKTPSTKKQAEYYEGGTVPFVKPGDLDTDVPLYETETYVTLEGAAHATLLPKNSVLVSCIGNLGKVSLLGRESICNQQINAILPCDALEPMYTFFWTKTIRPWMEKNSSATTVTILNKGRFSTAPIQVPPKNEQTRIVKAIESHQQRSSKARTALTEVSDLIKLLRHSILRSAFSGRLTADWRKKNPDVEPADKLLERIRTERRQRWETDQLAAFEAKGKKPPKNWQCKYKQPEAFDYVEIDDFQPVVIGKPKINPPDGWIWASLTDVAILESGHTPRKSVPEYWKDGDIPWISLRDIRAAHGKFITDTEKMPTKLGIENSSARLLPAGTVCFSRDISVGFSTIMKRDMSTTQHFANWICGDLILNKYLLYAFMAARESLVRSGQGTTVRTIYMPALKRMHVLLPSFKEQEEIVRQIEEQRQRVRSIEQSLNGMDSSLTQLNQSILSKAFRGELVPQDPNDEPASALLDRTRAAREKQETEKKASKKMTSKKKASKKKVSRKSKKPKE